MEFLIVVDIFWIFPLERKNLLSRQISKTKCDYQLAFFYKQSIYIRFIMTRNSGKYLHATTVSILLDLIRSALRDLHH